MKNNDADILNFIIDDVLMVQDENLECIDAYVWATDNLVDKLEEQESPERFSNADNINFYAIYNLRTKELTMEGTYWTFSDGKEVQAQFDLPLTSEEKTELITEIEKYCQKRYGISCLELVNEVREDAGLPVITNSLADKIKDIKSKGEAEKNHHKANEIGER